MTSLPRVCVLDATFIAKTLIPSPDSTVAKATFRELFLTENHPLIYVPDLLFIECANVLWKAMRFAGYAQEQARQDMLSLLELELTVVSTADVCAVALEIAAKYGISAYDACYIALTIRTNGTLLTFDQRLSHNLAQAPFEILLLDADKH